MSREGHGPLRPWRERVPLHLVLLEQGRISEEQLREARRSGMAEALDEAAGLEEWLRESGVLSEAALTRALSTQWNCPVFSLSATPGKDLAAAIPKFLAEVLGALPAGVAAGRILYLAFAERIDRSLTYAIEHVTGLQVAAGMARGTEFRRERELFLSGRAPATTFIEAESRRGLAQTMASRIEEAQAVDARLARVHELWWLRIWRRVPGRAALPACDAVEDLLASVRSPGEGQSRWD